jgi:ssDNA-binding Zn-finger/Zn-ribbon topoisomerase 1
MSLTQVPIKIVLVNSSLRKPSKRSSLRTVQVKKPIIRHIAKTTKSKTSIFKKEIIQYLDSNGYLSWSSKEKKYIILGTNSPKNGLVSCPQCNLGELMVIRSRTTRKRFMGCSNFYGGCKASSPLLQKARLRATKNPCDVCKWPMVIFRYSRNQKWTKQCSNFSCKSRLVKPSK